jgi:hypothetical protein
MSSLGQARASHSTARNYMRVCRLRQLLRFSSFFKSSTSLRKRIIANNALPQLLQRVSALRQRLQLLRRMDCASYCNYCNYCDYCGGMDNSKLLGCKFKCECADFSGKYASIHNCFFWLWGGGETSSANIFLSIATSEGLPSTWLPMGRPRGCIQKREGAHTEEHKTNQA